MPALPDVPLFNASSCSFPLTTTSSVLVQSRVQVIASYGLVMVAVLCVASAVSISARDDLPFKVQETRILLGVTLLMVCTVLSPAVYCNRQMIALCAPALQMVVIGGLVMTMLVFGVLANAQARDQSHALLSQEILLRKRHETEFPGQAYSELLASAKSLAAMQKLIQVCILLIA